MRLSSAMTKLRILALAVILVVEAVMLGSIPANAAADSRVDELFTALRDGKFSEATAHFDSTMKTALSADQLSAVWLQIVAAEGKLENWKVLSHGMLSGTDVSSVVLAFEHGKLMATVAVRPQTGEIAGLYFRPLTTQPAASSPATSPPYADATKFRSEAVTVGKDPWKLPGTLTHSRRRRTFSRGRAAGGIGAARSRRDDRPQSRLQGSRGRP